VPDGRLVVYVAHGCHLCEAALAVVERVAGDLSLTYEAVGIDGDPELERLHRADLPVVVIDGERAFRHFVDPDELRRRLERPV
jgi:hypothetical protein